MYVCYRYIFNLKKNMSIHIPKYSIICTPFGLALSEREISYHKDPGDIESSDEYPIIVSHMGKVCFDISGNTIRSFIKRDGNISILDTRSWHISSDPFRWNRYNKITIIHNLLKIHSLLDEMDKISIEEYPGKDITVDVDPEKYKRMRDNSDGRTQYFIETCIMKKKDASVKSYDLYKFYKKWICNHFDKSYISTYYRLMEEMRIAGYTSENDMYRDIDLQRE